MVHSPDAFRARRSATQQRLAASRHSPCTPSRRNIGMKRRGGIMLASAVTVAASLASTAGAGTTAVASSQAINCNSKLKIALVAPFTGGAGFLGNEQLSWAKYAVKTLAPKYGLKITLVTGDTPVEQGAAPAQTIAQKFIADKAVVAVLGPSTSGAV